MKMATPIRLACGAIVSCAIPPLPVSSWRRYVDIDETRPVWLYAIRNEAAGQIKLGVSSNLPGRLAALQSAHGSPLELALAKPGLRRDERAVHERFAADRLMGEWFRETPAITEWVAQQNADIPVLPDVTHEMFPVRAAGDKR